MKYAICDIDGTVADLSHRLPYIKGHPQDWDAFFDNVLKDKPIQHVLDMVDGLSHQGYGIVFLSGRSDRCRQDTWEWLNAHLTCPIIDLYMREDGDTRADYVIKRELYEQCVKDMGGEPEMVIDDRPQIINRLWRTLDMPIVRVGDWFEEERSVKTQPGTLYIMVGPSGSGKTTLIKPHDVLSKCFYVSSDNLRGIICGDWKDQSQNDKVFQVLHDIVRASVNAGVDTVVDATNIRNKDRKSLVNLTKGEVVYVVVNRPMEEKVQTGGWRNEVDGLLQRHDQIFNSNIRAILNGDGNERVKIWDMRKSGQ